MDHPHIDEHDLVGRYLEGELTADEEEAFEEHLLTCAQCQDEVSAEERLGAGLAGLAEAGELPSEPWPLDAEGPRRAWSLAWAASIVLALLPSFFLLRHGQDLERQLAEAKASETASGLDSTQAALRQDALRQDALRQRLDEVTRPRAGVPLLRLEPTRSAGDPAAGAPAHRLTLVEGDAWVVLVVEPPEPLASSYRLELEGPAGEVTWSLGEVSPDGYGAVTATVYAADLSNGVHHLRAVPSDGGEPLVVSLDVRR